MKHTLGRRIAASAVAFLEADSQADKKKKKKWGDDCHGRNGILGII